MRAPVGAAATRATRTQRPAVCSPARLRRSRLALLVGAAVAAGLLVPTAHAGPTGAPALQVSTNPGLYPGFVPTVEDYVLRCVAGSPVRVSVSTPPGVSVSVAAGLPLSGSFTVGVPLRPGQDFAITVQSAKQPTQSYFARCLPPDFPTWSAARSGSPQAEWYVAMPRGPQTATPYAAIFDDNGVPLWWAPTRGGWFATVLSSRTVGWTDGSGALVENLDGSAVHRITAVRATADFHELQPMADGDYLMVASKPTPPVDLSSVGGPRAGILLDNVIEELTPTGKLAWSWSSAAHISPSELRPEWDAQALAGGVPLDAYHMNSVAEDEDGVVVSFRHLNAIYRITEATGAIAWKLGGTPTQQSLTVVGDPVFAGAGSLSGQHDARLLPDGSLTLHDNGTTGPRPPRAVRYAINTNRRTATLLESLSDPAASSSFCCGSARRLPGGDWVVSWGASHYSEELGPRGNVVMRFQWPPGWFSYRVVPVLPGTLSRAALRAGMDARQPPAHG